MPPRTPEGTLSGSPPPVHPASSATSRTAESHLVPRRLHPFTYICTGPSRPPGGPTRRMHRRRARRPREVVAASGVPRVIRSRPNHRGDGGGPIRVVPVVPWDVRDVGPQRPGSSRPMSSSTASGARGETGTSSATLPSRSRTIRLPRAATTGSWVATMTVSPRSRRRPTRRSMISAPVEESRFPVGSSARTRPGSLMRARAMATRCCSPPESRDGNEEPRSPSPTASRSSRARRSLSNGVRYGRTGAATLSSTESAGRRWNRWNTNPMVRRYAVCCEEYAAVVRAAHLITGDREEAADVAQEAFAQAYERWRSVSGLHSPGAWVQRVATNLAPPPPRGRSSARGHHTNSPCLHKYTPTDRCGAGTAPSVPLRHPGPGHSPSELPGVG